MNASTFDSCLVYTYKFEQTIEFQMAPHRYKGHELWSDICLNVELKNRDLPGSSKSID